MTSVYDRIDIAAAHLAEHGIKLVIDTNSQRTPGDAWVDAEEVHGERIAFIHTQDRYLAGEVTVFYRYVARRVINAFTAAGCAVEWSGEACNAVLVDLGD